MTRVLLVEDNRADARLFAELLAEVEGITFTLTSVDTLARALEALPGQDVVFLDLSLPDAHGIPTVVQMATASPAMPIVVLTGNDDDRVAQEAVKAGAQDYLRKGEISPALIARTALYAIERKKAEEHTTRLARSDEAVRRARFVASISVALSASLDLDTVLRDVMRLLVPTLGDFCVLDLVGDGGRIDRVAHGVADPSLDSAVRVAYQYPPGPQRPTSPVLAVIKNGQSLVIDNLDLRASAPDERAYDAAVAMGSTAILITPLIARGRVVGAISYIVGPSRRRYTEDLRLLAEEIGERIALAIENGQLYASAQRAIRAREELLAVVSHDLRNPLGVVALVVQMLEQNPAALPTALPRAQRAVDRMQRLIADLLDVARIENGTLGVDLKAVDLTSVLDDVIEQHRPLAADRGIRLQRALDLRIGPALVDRHRLQQALGNLIGNALKFTPAGGTIRLGAEPRGETVAIEVSDSGPGIPREHLARIFDRYYQRERRSDGVGLGLAIVKGIVDAHRGTIEVESEVGSGSTFRICVPRATSTTGGDVLPLDSRAAR